MSGYDYTENGHNGQQFNQYMQQYSSQGFQQLGPPQVGQYRPLHNSAQHGMPYSGAPILPQHHIDTDLVAASAAIGGYPDYSGVYVPSSHEPPFATPPQPRYPVPQHIPHAANLAYQHASQVSLQHQPQVPLDSSIHVKQVQIPAPRVSQKVRGSPNQATVHPAKKARVSAKRASNFSKKTEEWDAEHGSEDDDYSMDGMKTKSGRKVHKPSQFNPATKTPSKKRGAPGKKVILDSLFCKVCDRGHSPKSNLIVFCDGCNSPYHQLCHTPVIDNLLITLPDAEWFCSTCDEKRGQRKLEMGHDGSDLTEEQKRTYMTSLPTAHLVQLVMRAASVHPELGLFSHHAKKQMEAVHDAHTAAILQEQMRLAAPIYQAVPGDEIKKKSSGDSLLEGQIIEAMKALGKPVQNRDVMEYVEANHVVNPSSFRVRCAEQITRCVESGQLDREGTLLTLSKQLPTPVAARNGSELKPSSKIASGLPTSQNTDEQYPRVVGIKLPPESAADDGFAMQEFDSPAFKHVEHVNVP